MIREIGDNLSTTIFLSIVVITAAPVLIFALILFHRRQMRRIENGTELLQLKVKLKDINYIASN